LCLGVGGDGELYGWGLGVPFTQILLCKMLHYGRRISAEVRSHLVSEVVARFQRVAGNFSVNLGGGGTADD